MLGPTQHKNPNRIFMPGRTRHSGNLLGILCRGSVIIQISKGFYALSFYASTYYLIRSPLF